MPGLPRVADDLVFPDTGRTYLSLLDGRWDHRLAIVAELEADVDGGTGDAGMGG